MSSFLACTNIASGGSWRDNILCRQAGFASCEQLDVLYTFEVSEAQGRGNVVSSLDVSEGAEHLVLNYTGEDLVNLLETTFNFTIKQNDQSLPEVEVVGVSINVPEKTITLDLGETALFDGEGKEILQLNKREGYKWEPSELEITNLAESKCRRDGFAGGFSVEDSGSPCLIKNQKQLQKINDNLDGHYKLINSIDFKPPSSTPIAFTPIGTATAPFTGSIDGNGHTLQNLEISMSSKNDVGFIRASAGTARIERLGMIDVEIAGNNDVGGFVGNAGSIILSQSYLIGSIEGKNHVGGLVGKLDEGTIQNTYTVGNIKTLTNTAGGLIGLYEGGTVRNSYSITDVTGPSVARELGGIMGASSLIQSPPIRSVYWWSNSRQFGAGSNDNNSNNTKDVGEEYHWGELGFISTLLKCPVAPNTRAESDCGAAADDQRLLYIDWNPDNTKIWSFGDNNSYPVLRLRGDGFPSNDTPVVRSADLHELFQSRHLAFSVTRPNFAIGDTLTNITSDFNVPVSINGFSVTWISDNTTVLDIDSNTGNVSVTRPTMNTSVILTANLTTGEGASLVSLTKTFNLTIRAP